MWIKKVRKKIEQQAIINSVCWFPAVTQVDRFPLPFFSPLYRFFSWITGQRRSPASSFCSSSLLTSQTQISGYSRHQQPTLHTLSWRGLLCPGMCAAATGLWAQQRHTERECAEFVWTAERWPLRHSSWCDLQNMSCGWHLYTVRIMHSSWEQRGVFRWCHSRSEGQIGESKFFGSVDCYVSHFCLSFLSHILKLMTLIIWSKPQPFPPQVHI